MPTPSTSDLPIPKSWDEFEDIVWDIYTRKWEDPRAQRYGRKGQSQNGIDIYGQRNSSNEYIAIQCKRYTKTKLTEKRITADITKAALFSSPISEYWVATTQSRDSKIQDFIRDLNNKRKLEEKFIVHVIFWDDLCSYLASPGNHDFLIKHYSEWKQIFSSQREGETEKSESVRYLVALDIQQDCDFLQKILDHNENKYLSKKWQSCLSQNRSIW
jgi:predicted nucleic-acid-binding Zn-ribbon protein